MSVCVVKVDKELMVNRGEGDEGSSSPYFTVSCKTSHSSGLASVY